MPFTFDRFTNVELFFANRVPPPPGEEPPPPPPPSSFHPGSIPPPPPDDEDDFVPPAPDGTPAAPSRSLSPGHGRAESIPPPAPPQLDEDGGEQN